MTITASTAESSTATKAALRIRAISLTLLLLTPVSALGTKAGLWPYTVGLLLLVIAIFGSLIIQLINAVWLLRKPTLANKRVLRWACLFALPPLVIAATVMQGGSSAASGERIMIHNISTDILNPPEFKAAVARRGADSNPLDYSAENAAKQQKLYPDLSSLQTPLDKQAAFAKALTVAKAMQWDIYAEDADAGHIEAVATTFWFGFKDDIVIRIQATADGSQIDLRSVSRVGGGDMGANAARIKAFIAAFNQ